MMNIMGFETLEQAIARAPYYRSRGYRVNVMHAKSELAGSFYYLHCTYGEA